MSYIGFDQKIENEIVVLSNLKKEKNSSFFDSYRYEYFSPWSKRREKEEKEKGKTKEEIEKEVEIEIFEEKEKLKEQSLKSHYKIEKNKRQELEALFKSPKLKVSLSNPAFLGKGKICELSENKCIIYETKSFNKLYEIQLTNVRNINSVVELVNNDLIFFVESSKKVNKWSYDNEILIYRLKDKYYNLEQKIKEDRNGYHIQKTYSGCSVYSKDFELLDIKRLSGNRFMSISNYGFRIYSLNNNNQYSLILMDVHLEGIDKIYEIDENKYILCTNKHYGASLGGPDFDKLLIEEVKIKNISENELNKRILGFNEKERNFWDFDENNDNFNKEKSKKMISSLKLISSFETIFVYSTYGGRHNFSDFIILKNKYFCILVDNHLLIFNLLDNVLTKRYTFLIDGKKNLYIESSYNIRKWKNNNDNEFLLIVKNSIILLELNEENLKGKLVINLKIIGDYNFPETTYLLTDDENKFYAKGDKEDKKGNILIY